MKSITFKFRVGDIVKRKKSGFQRKIIAGSYEMRGARKVKYYTYLDDEKKVGFCSEAHLLRWIVK